MIFWVVFIRVLIRRVDHELRGYPFEIQKSDMGESCIVMLIKLASILVHSGLNGSYRSILTLKIVKYVIGRVWEVQEGNLEKGNLRTSFLDEKVTESVKTRDAVVQSTNSVQNRTSELNLKVWSRVPKFCRTELKSEFGFTLITRDVNWSEPGPNLNSENSIFCCCASEFRLTE